MSVLIHDLEHGADSADRLVVLGVCRMLLVNVKLVQSLVNTRLYISIEPFP